MVPPRLNAVWGVMMIHTICTLANWCFIWTFSLGCCVYSKETLLNSLVAIPTFPLLPFLLKLGKLEKRYFLEGNSAQNPQTPCYSIWGVMVVKLINLAEGIIKLLARKADYNPSAKLSSWLSRSVVVLDRRYWQGRRSLIMREPQKLF